MAEYIDMLLALSTIVTTTKEVEEDEITRGVLYILAATSIFFIHETVRTWYKR